MLQPAVNQNTWPQWRKILFRFFFVFFILYTAPWTWLEWVPALAKLTKWYRDIMDWMVHFSNAHLIHVKDELVPVNGSGDTSWAYAQLWMLLLLSVAGCIAWSVADRKRTNYVRLNYWLCTIVRYFVCSNCFSYGIIKIFALQMPFPNEAQMATTLGDLLPMRFSWLFIGYSTPYQAFLGSVEVLAALLLLYRRTATLGVLVATGVFMNVAVMNLSYDIPVKLYSMSLELMCLFLLAQEYKRLYAFFIQNRPAATASIYQVYFTERWQRITRIVLKTLFILVAFGWNTYDTIDNYKKEHKVNKTNIPFEGKYDAAVFVINNDTIQPLITDSLRWQDVIFENTGRASMKNHDTSFARHVYKRTYFRYYPDTLLHTIKFTNGSADMPVIYSFHYTMPDAQTLILSGTRGTSDSLYMVLKRNGRHFQLAEKQFHWLSEYNR